jgi:trans-aconitate 2-methyltransferase
MPVREWDGKTYDRISAPLEEMGLAVLERLPLTGDETVLDAGCGSGRVTEALIARLPRGRVIGVDGSAEMIDAARERLGPDVELHVQDLLALDVDPVDAIFSTATFHWITDHEALFARLHAALKPGGRLVAQCGGDGQAAAVHAAAETIGAREPYAPYLDGWVGPWKFACAENTERRLREAGFTEARAWLQVVPMETLDGEEWLRTIMLGSHLERLPEALRDDFVREVGAIVGVDPLRLDYVRLNIDATA